MNKQLTVQEGVTRFAIAQDNDYATTLVNTANDELVPYGLYMVTMIYSPKVHIAYVLAPSEKEAIAQVDQLPMDEGEYILEGREAIDSGEMTATAVRVPFHIRGWGLETF